MISRQHVVTGFFDGAESMREALDSSFKNTYTDTINWQYFCDPRMYTYLRTAPQNVFPREIFESFMRRLRLWCEESLGLVPMGLPHLHLMVNGCRLGLHSDFHNGAWGYVFSLTRWDRRSFFGGETLLLRDGIPSYKKHHVHGDVLYELIPAEFNQLLVFDDRIVHATPTIEGSMDPKEGRIAMVGHIRATSPIIRGGIPEAQTRGVIGKALFKLRERIKNYKDVQGTVAFRLEITEAGVVDSVTVLTNNLVTPLGGYGRNDSVATVRSIIQQVLSEIKFPGSSERAAVIVPVLVPLPDLQPIELSVPIGASDPTTRAKLHTQLARADGTGLVGGWEGETFIVREPIAGTVRFEGCEAKFYFDSPMWVPSQRESFERDLIAWAKSTVVEPQA